MYDCHGDTPEAVRAGSVELRAVTQLAAAGGAGAESGGGGRRGSALGSAMLSSAAAVGGGGGGGGRAVAGLTVVDGWRALLGIVDGQVVCYDVHTCRPLAALPETKGAVLLSVHAASERLVVVTKKKQLLTYAWHGAGSSNNNASYRHRGNRQNNNAAAGSGAGSSSSPLVRVANEARAAEFSCVLPEMPVCVCLCGSGAESDDDDAAGAGAGAGAGGRAGEGSAAHQRSSTMTMSKSMSPAALSPAALSSFSPLLVVLGYKKHYELKDLATGRTTRLLDTDRPAVALLLPPSPVREGRRVLLSNGSKGVFVNLTTRSVVPEERLTWSAPPVDVSSQSQSLASIHEVFPVLPSCPSFLRAIHAMQRCFARE